MPRNEQANRTQRPGVPAGTAAGIGSNGLSPTLAGECAGMLRRALTVHKAETIAAAVDRKPSSVYSWAATGRVEAQNLPILAEFDPDPESLSRIAGHLLANVAQRAILRRASGSALLILEEVSPGRVVPR